MPRRARSEYDLSRRYHGRACRDVDALPSAGQEQARLTPNGGLCLTAAEMVRVLLGLLQGLREGQLGGGCGLLIDEALAKMYASHFSSQGVEVAFGFLRRRLWPNGPVLLYHVVEDRPGVDGVVCVIPSLKLGFWTVANTTTDTSADGGRFCDELLEAFLAKFLPAATGCRSQEVAIANWFQALPPLRTDHLLDLYCFPYVGGSAPVLYESWCTHLPDFVQVRAVLLPGRGTRVKEQPMTNILEMADRIATAMLPLLREEPFAFFGHGYGAVLAFEVARAVKQKIGREPLILFVAGSASPSLAVNGNGSFCWAPEPEEAAIEDDGDEDLGLGPPPRALLHNRADNRLAELLSTSTRLTRHFRRNSLMFRSMISTIRADITAEETYAYQHASSGVAPLSCRVTVCTGAADPHVSEDGLSRWRDVSTGSSGVHRFAGDHFFLEDAKPREQLLHLVASDLSRQLTRHPNWLEASFAGRGG